MSPSATSTWAPWKQRPEHLQHQVCAGQPETATDFDFEGVEAVIAHEYFHNWTGNRVTCRDWFQLSLKEGLTVFRDQEFSADMQSRAVKRIEDDAACAPCSFLRTPAPPPTRCARVPHRDE